MIGGKLSYVYKQHTANTHKYQIFLKQKPEFIKLKSENNIQNSREYIYKVQKRLEENWVMFTSSILPIHINTSSC